MKNLIKASMLSVGILSVLGLTACQSTPQKAESKQHMQQKGDRHFNKGERAERNGDYSRHHHGRLEQKNHRTPLTAEQKAAFEKQRAERYAQHQATRQAFVQACEGKVGQKVAVKIGEKTIEGSCEVQFRPTQPERMIRHSPNQAQASTATTNS